MGGLDVSISPLAGMLAALNTAAEFYFATSSSTVEVVFPFPVSDDDRASLRAACSSLSLHMPMPAQPPAVILAASAHGIGQKRAGASVEETNEPDDDSAQLILTVDYSRAALTAMLVVEELGVFEYRRVCHDVP